MRSVVVMVESESDLLQCREGLAYLQAAERRSEAKVVDVFVASIHCNTETVLQILRRLQQSGASLVLITLAGRANHLTGTVDAYLRYHCRNQKVVVVGVAGRDAEDESQTEIAERSISEVPGTQVVHWDEHGQFVGMDGFYRACIYAVKGELPELQVPEPREVLIHTLVGALQYSRRRVQSNLVEEERGNVSTDSG